MTPKPKPLSCGGKGPCCHVGYAHRHCEHCDQVVAVAPYWWQTINPAPLPIRPYQPYWGTYQFNSAAGGVASGTMYMEGALNSDRATGFAQALEASWTDAAKATAAHTCEVK